MEFGEIMVLAVFIVPAILAGIYAMKGKPMDQAETKCQYCYMKVNAAAKVCPYCTRRGPVSFTDKAGKKAWMNTPKSRFIAGYITIFLVELVLIGLVGSMFS